MIKVLVLSFVILLTQNILAQNVPYLEAKRQGESLPSRNVGNDPRFPSQIPSSPRIRSERYTTAKQRAKISLEAAENLLNGTNPNYDQIAYWLELAVQDNPKSKKAHLLLGSAYLHLELFKSASLAYQEALTLDDKSFDAMVGLAKSNFYLKDFDAAIDSYKKAVELNSNDYNANVMLANSYFMQKRFFLAAAGYQRTLEINSQSVEAHYNLALCHFNLKNSDAAMKEKELLKTLNKQAAENLEKILGS